MKNLPFMDNNDTKDNNSQFENAYFILLKDLEKAKYYGEVILKFENGKIVHMKKTESIKLK